MHLDTWLITVPPLVVYLLVAVVVGIESIGVPLPGEIVLVGAALLATRPGLGIDPVVVAASATAGAIVGDSIGYTLGRRYGLGLLGWLGRRFPRHMGPGHVDMARRVFERHGVWAVLFGRFVAILRILAGPLAGTMRMRYPVFLAANATGAVLWAGGTVAAVQLLGLVAETWLHRFSWVALVIAILVGLVVSRQVRARLEPDTAQE
ncbi:MULTISPECIES: DedA family protein [Pseudonocardia]|uniref:Membrane protein n=1 Tax=Pseudonocardia saturnea TaxID=33909 RepID=A0ABQ0RW93_9PSEU|nr:MULTISPECIES: DedA family protein [Pseudonocardia]BBG03503.1 membrane protein [Pseudonocardia autotrophica]GEC24923.1 membrane protein [Pseudonocardia saturnea]